MKYVYVLLAFLFFACTNDDFHNPPITDQALSINIVDENPNFWIQVDGVIDWMINTDTLVIGSATIKGLDTLVTITWIEEQILFCSKDVEFRLEGLVSGTQECEAYSTEPSRLLIERESSCLVFELSEFFGQCLEKEYCEPGDEVFSFRIIIRRAM